MKRCHIFAGGELGNIADYWFPNHHGYVICADSGYKHAKKLKIKPDVIVGDFDSYGGELPKDCEIIRTVPEKDDTDTLMAVKIAIERGYDLIYLYGALGGERFDHAFANIQTMLYAREHGANIIILGNGFIGIQGAEEGEAMYCDERDRWGCRYLSVFALTETVKIKSFRGVKYPLENYEMKASYPIGVSNEIIGGQAYLEIESGLALIIQS